MRQEKLCPLLFLGVPGPNNKELVPFTHLYAPGLPSHPNQADGG